MLHVVLLYTLSYCLSSGHCLAPTTTGSDEPNKPVKWFTLFRARHEIPVIEEVLNFAWGQGLDDLNLLVPCQIRQVFA